MSRRRVAVLGATGSIGESTFKVLQQFPEEFEPIALVSRNQVDKLVEQAKVLKPRIAVVTNKASFSELKEKLPPKIAAGTSAAAMVEIVTSDDVDVVLCAIVGTGGLIPVIEALKAGKKVALASKEIMVMAGELVKPFNSQIIPVDSEHSAIFQCLQGRDKSEIKNVILTASGGAFRDWTIDEMKDATYEDALNHPTWDMGPKVTIDSATMMNKALELVEAHFLFGVEPEKLKVVIHPQSIVHSMVELVDNSIITQMACPDMRLAIQYALSHPNRLDGKLPQLDFSECLELTFESPDFKKYPALNFAYMAMRAGGTMPAVMNAANEVAVEKFCNKKIAFSAIWSIIEKTMNEHKTRSATNLDNILEADCWARNFASGIKS